MKNGTIGYLIKPQEGIVQRVRCNDWRDIYKWIGADTFDACTVTERRDAIYVDDEGLLKQQSNDNFFKCATYDAPLAGIGLMLGTDAEGDSVAPSIPWEQFKQMEFVKRAFMLNANTAMLAEFRYLDEILKRE